MGKILSKVSKILLEGQIIIKIDLLERLLMQNKLNIVQIKIEELNPAPYNPRKWDEQSLNRLKESIKLYGFVDPAFSTSEEADKSAIIIASLTNMGGKKQMYIHPDPFNGKWSSPNLIDLIESNYHSLGSQHAIKIIVEQAGQ